MGRSGSRLCTTSPLFIFFSLPHASRTTPFNLSQRSCSELLLARSRVAAPLAAIPSSTPSAQHAREEGGPAAEGEGVDAHELAVLVVVLLAVVGCGAGARWGPLDLPVGLDFHRLSAAAAAA